MKKVGFKFKLELTTSTVENLPREMMGDEVMLILSRGSSRSVVSKPLILGGAFTDTLVLDITLYRDSKTGTSLVGRLVGEGMRVV